MEYLLVVLSTNVIWFVIWLEMRTRYRKALREVTAALGESLQLLNESDRNSQGAIAALQEIRDLVQGKAA